MIAATEKLVDAGLLGLDTMSALFNVAFDSAARLTTLNLDRSRAVLQEGTAHASAMLTARNARDLLDHETALSRLAVDNATHCIRSAYEIVSEGQHAMLALIEPRLAEFEIELADTFEKAAKSVPGGADLALAAVMSALEVAKRAASGAVAHTNRSGEATSRSARKTA